MFDNLLLNTDSYKASHYLQYPPRTRAMTSYIESRGGDYSSVLFFGLQAILREYLSKPVTGAMVDEARAFFQQHGEPFNEEGFRVLVNRHGGYMPVEICAVPEGLSIPSHEVLVTITSMDPDLFWLPSYLESVILRLWYPSTVATRSWQIKMLIRRYLQETSDDPEAELPFKLHDFGARGVSSTESAALGGMAHLVNFKGTDTVLGILAAQRYYDEPMAGYSIPAAEHSTITSWGRENEVEAYRNMLNQFAKPGSTVAVVSDSYDIYHAVSHLWGEKLRDQVIKSGATLVVRPDSGDPLAVVLQCMDTLALRFGVEINNKGYKVLRHVRLIQGDGVNEKTISTILAALKKRGFSASNIAFGMGGALLQGMNRDTLRWAMKCSAVEIDGEWREVYKAPVTDINKRSKRGRLMLYQDQAGCYHTGQIDESHLGKPVLRPVFRRGELLNESNFAEIRARADRAPL